MLRETITSFARDRSRIGFRTKLDYLQQAPISIKRSETLEMSSNQGKKNMKSDPVNINVDNVELMSTLNQDSCVVLSIPQDINHVFPYSLETAKKDNNTKYILRSQL